MAKLAKRSIDAFRYRGGWDVHWDDEIPGFGVRVYPSGKRFIVLSDRYTRGSKRLLVLGRYGADLTLAQARTKVIKERGDQGRRRPYGPCPTSVPKPARARRRSGSI